MSCTSVSTSETLTMSGICTGTHHLVAYINYFFISTIQNNHNALRAKENKLLLAEKLLEIYGCR